MKVSFMAIMILGCCIYTALTVYYLSKELGNIKADIKRLGENPRNNWE